MGRRFLFGLGVALFLASGNVCAYASGSGDFQYWQIEDISWKLNDLWKLNLGEETYFKNDASDFYYQHTELGATYSGLAKWLDVSAHFRHGLTESRSNLWLREEQPGFSAIFKGKFLGCSVSDRNRFEYRIRENADQGWRYRNQVTVKFPWKWTKLEIQPYFADEFFVDIDLERINENRNYTGFSFKISKNIGMDVFYMWRRLESSGKWGNNQVLGAKLRLSF